MNQDLTHNQSQASQDQEASRRQPHSLPSAGNKVRMLLSVARVAASSSYIWPIILTISVIILFTFFLLFLTANPSTTSSGPSTPGSPPGSPRGAPGSPPGGPSGPSSPGSPAGPSSPGSPAGPSGPGTPPGVPQPPPPLGNVTTAPGLANAIARSCNDAVVSQATISCLKSLESTTPTAVLDRLKSSAFSYYYLQCVDFVQAILVLLNQPPLLKNGATLRNALSHAGKDKVDGYAFIPMTKDAIIQLGDIPIWGGPAYQPYGHMAYVIDVTADNRSFTVVEANLGTSGQVRVMPKAKGDPELSGWLRKL